jgi:FIST N domain
MHDGRRDRQWVDGDWHDRGHGRIDADTAARVLVTLVPGIASSTDGIAAAFSAWERELGSTMLDLDPDRWVGIVLIDGLSGAEERIMDRIGNLTNLLFVGGSAGDDLAFARTLVAADGRLPQTPPSSSCSSARTASTCSRRRASSRRRLA